MMKAVTYRDAGVNIDAANRATEKIKELARSTFNARTLSEIGSFGGMFDGAFPNMRQPVLVASADGVGTKLKIAFATGIHNTAGRDLVNHCVNDILVQGARPLFFLDYIATGRLAPDTIAAIVEGMMFRVSSRATRASSASASSTAAWSRSARQRSTAAR